MNVVRSRVDRQIILYTSAQKDPSKSYPIPPRATRKIEDLTEEEVNYIKQNHPEVIIT